MKVIVLMICLLFSVSCKTNDLISTALCLIRNKTVKEEALNIFNKILNKDYENIFQNLVTAYFKVKDVLLNQCFNKDDVKPAFLRSLSESYSPCDYEKIDLCVDNCRKLKSEPHAIEIIRVCTYNCYLKYCNS